MAWKRGKSGNPHGRRKDKLFRDALIMELKSKGAEMPELRQIARKAIDQAVDGDTSARSLVIERLDGKLPRAVVDAETEQPVTVIIKHLTRSITNRQSDHGGPERSPAPKSELPL